MTKRRISNQTNLESVRPTEENTKPGLYLPFQGWVEVPDMEFYMNDDNGVNVKFHFQVPRVPENSYPRMITPDTFEKVFFPTLNHFGNVAVGMVGMVCGRGSFVVDVRSIDALPCGELKNEVFVEENGHKSYYGFPELHQELSGVTKQITDLVAKYSMLNGRVYDFALVDERMKQFGIFNSIIDENKLATYFVWMRNQLSDSHRCERLECDEVTFSAYLFVLVEKLKLGNHTFSDNARKSFYEFCQTKVFVGMNDNLQTFYNRLNEMHLLRKGASNEREKKLLEKDVHYEDFGKVLHVFGQGTFGFDLERLRKEGVRDSL